MLLVPPSPSSGKSEEWYCVYIYMCACMYMLVNVHIWPHVTPNYFVITLMPDNFLNSPKLWNTQYFLYVVLFAYLSSCVFYIPILELIQMFSAQCQIGTNDTRPPASMKGEAQNLYCRWLKGDATWSSQALSCGKLSLKMS